MKIDTDKLVDGETLLKLLFHDDCRPSVRWLERMMQNRIIPRYKIGHHNYFDPVKVREKLERRNLIRAIEPSTK